MDEKKRLLKNTGLIALGNFGAKMISFLLLPLYTSILTTTEYGTYDFIVAVSAFCLPIVTISIHEAMFRFIIDTGTGNEEFKKVISNAFLVVLMGISVMAVIFYGIDVVFPVENMLYIWLYVSANALYVFANNLLRGLGKIKEYAIISSGKNIFQLILNVLVVAVFRWGMKGLLFSMCVSEIIAFLVVFVLIRLWKNFRIKYISVSKIKEMLVYSIPLIPNALCAQIINLSDRLIISAFMGKSANGIYSVSYKFPNMIETVYHYFYTAWSESASRVFAKGKKAATEYYQSLLETISNFMFSVILLMVAGMPILFRIFVRGDYIQGFKYIPMLMFAMYFDSIGKFYSGIFTALKKTKIMAWSTMWAALVNILINIIAIKKIGLYAAAGSTLIATIVLVILRRKYISKEINIKMDRKTIIIELLMAFIVLLLYDYNNWLKIIISVCVAFIYFMVANKKVVKSMIKKIKG